MFLKSSSKVLLLVTFSLVIITSQTSADPDQNNIHQNHGCQVNSDCGTGVGFSCNPSNGECTCPGAPGKSYVVVRGAKPQCQKLALIGESCNYGEQCLMHAGKLSRCFENKCQCYDTDNDGRDVVRPYGGTCYRATALDVECESENQCKASIEPEEHVKCFFNSTVQQSFCRCIEGQHCHEKSGAEAVAFTSMTTLAVLGLMATQVLL